ncbi:MAG: glutathione peroxidase [Tissierellia bacterium]|nr:glutathione peroxidase [Tissierellia bacterium]
MNIYDFEVKDIDGNLRSMREFENKVLLIVNVASKCGFTNQYEDLQRLYEKYRDDGFEVLAFPCNQFGNQEPEENNMIKQFCKVNFGISFPIFAKIYVNGENQDPLFKFLKSEQKGLVGNDIKWNFTKFLVDKNGHVISRFAPTTKPKDIEIFIKNLINE